MWSGPRNLSTALMRSWENRADTAVADEPLYAAWLAATGIEHPGRAEILAHHETDPAAAIAALLGPLPPGRTILFQKQMSHHLLHPFEEAVPGWLDRMTHAFLIRDPEAVIRSFDKVVADPTPEALGLPQQCRLLERLRSQGIEPPVIDAMHLRRDPRGVLSALCRALGVPFDEAMLRWPAGPRESDGVWARHWYASVERSTGFEPPDASPPPPLPQRLRPVLAACAPFYERLRSAPGFIAAASS